MPSMQISLPDDVYWKLFAWAARNAPRKAHERAEDLVSRHVDDADDVDTTPPAEAGVA